MHDKNFQLNNTGIVESAIRIKQAPVPILSVLGPCKYVDSPSTDKNGTGDCLIRAVSKIGRSVNEPEMRLV